MCDVLLPQFFVYWCFVAKVLYLIFAGWLYQVVLLISFNTWPIGLTYTAVGPGETEGIEYSNSWIYWVLWKCSWNGHGKSLLQKWTWGYAPDTSTLTLPFSDLTLSPSLMISMIMIWCSLKKFLHKPLSGAPQKCFQSCPALAKASPGYLAPEW